MRKIKSFVLKKNYDVFYEILSFRYTNKTLHTAGIPFTEEMNNILTYMTRWDQICVALASWVSSRE